MYRPASAPRPRRSVVSLILAASLAAFVTQAALAARPTLEAITIDGNVDDWTRVLVNPLQVSFDHDGSTLTCAYSTDADCPVQGSGRDLRQFAWTYDDTYLYVMAGRQAQFANQQAFWFYMDVTGPAGVPDGLMGTGDFLLRIVFKGGGGETFNDLYRYVPVAPAGDPMADAGGRADGFDVAGSGASGPAWTETAPYGGSADGLTFEERVPWSALGVAPGWPVNFHVGSSNSTNAGNIASQVDDNMGGLDGRMGTLGFADPKIDPDQARRVDAALGAVVPYAHVVRNDGNRPATFALATTSTLGLELALMRDDDCDGVGDGAPFAVDKNGDGDFADASDIVAPGADSDGDGVPDLGTLAAGASRCLIVELRVPAGTAGVEDVTVVEAFEPATRAMTTDSAVDRTSVGLVTLSRNATARAVAGNVTDYALVACNDGTAGKVQMEATSTLGCALTLLADDDCNGTGDRIVATDLAGDGAWDPPVTGDSDGDGRPDAPLDAGACACFVLTITVPATAVVGDSDVTVANATGAAGAATVALTTTVSEPLDLSPDYVATMPDAHCGIASGPAGTEVLVGAGKSAFFAHLLENALPEDGSFALELLDHVQAWPARFWSDPNGDGSVDDGVVITQQDGVPRNGGRASIVLEIKVPATAPLGETDQACARAQSAGGATAVAADELRVSSLLTFSDPVFTTPASFFAPCDTVFLRATALPRGPAGHRITYEVQYRDPAGLLARATFAQADPAGEITDSLDLPAAAPGTWTIALSDATGVVAAVEITVESALSLSPLATAQPAYQLMGDDVSVLSSVRNESVRVTLTDIVRSYVLTAPGAAAYYDSATRSWQPYSGTESTRTAGPDNLLPGASIDDGFTLLSVSFPGPGVYVVRGRAVDASCGAVLVETARAFVVAPTELECADAVDNDGDGMTDCADSDCIGDPACPEVDNCTDGVDNDGDTLIDCLDPDCIGDAACPETGHCDDGIDNDGDGMTDCDDPDCAGDPACPETGHCSDGVDNDGDTLADCLDPDCIGDPACPETGHCDDGIDNDGDGDVDCDDFDCIGDAACPETGHCHDGIDNDGDGLVDCHDPDCVADPAGDCDGDGEPNGTDCAPADPTAFRIPPVVSWLRVERPLPGVTDADLSWEDVAPQSGTGTVVDVFTGRIGALREDRDFRRAECFDRDLHATRTVDTRLAGDGCYFYLVRAQNACGNGPVRSGSAGPVLLGVGLCD